MVGCSVPGICPVRECPEENKINCRVAPPKESWLTDGSAGNAKLQLSRSPCLDCTSTVSRVLVAVGADVQVIGVGLSHQ